MRRIFILGAALGALSAPAHAVTCSVRGTSGVHFGTYDVFSRTPLDVAGTITLDCAEVGAFDALTIDLSAGGAPNVLARALTSAGDRLAYNLYLDAARTVVWGDGTGGSATYGPYTPTADGAFDARLYGRIPAGQAVAGGIYGDTIVVTINY